MVGCIVYWVDSVSQCVRLPRVLRTCILVVALESSWRMVSASGGARRRHLAHQAACFASVAAARGWKNETNETLPRDFLTSSVSAELADDGKLAGESFRLEVYDTASRGRGVKLHGEAPAGVIVAIYGGTLRQFFLPNILAEPLTWARTMWKGSHWIWMHRSECCPRCFIDGAAVGGASHPLGHGQFINHPPAGVPPNVIYFGLFTCSPLEADNIIKARPRLPVAYTTNYTAAVVLLALRRLRDGEELFADYMLPPPHLLEGSWYEPVLESPCEPEFLQPEV